jgi:amino acid permease
MAKIRRTEKVLVKLTNYEAFANTLKSLMGIGFLSCPKEFKNVGLLGGIIGTLIILTIAIMSNLYLLAVIKKLGPHKSRTLGDIAF